MHFGIGTQGRSANTQYVLYENGLFSEAVGTEGRPFQVIPRCVIFYSLFCHKKTRVIQIVLKLGKREKSVDKRNDSFTMERESNQILPFLDVESHQKGQSLFGRKVYRKKTNTNRYLHFSSFHHMSHKISVVGLTVLQSAEDLWTLIPYRTNYNL